MIKVELCYKQKFELSKFDITRFDCISETFFPANPFPLADSHNSLNITTQLTLSFATCTGKAV